MNKRSQLTQIFFKELASYTQARVNAKHELCVYHLSRAHIISQLRWYHHFYVHFLMFEYSWTRKEWNEVRAQIIRMAATVPGHLFKKLPIGNTGWSSVPLMAKLPLPPDLERYLK